MNPTSRPAEQPRDDRHLAAALRQDVPAVLRAIAGSAVEEVRLERNGVRLSMRRMLQDAAASAATAGGEAAAGVPAPPPEMEAESGLMEVASAHVGIFHRSREPGGPILAEVGAHLEAGAPIGVVETLGMSADVEAPASGQLVEVLAQDEQPVEYGQILAIVQPD